MIFNIKQVWLGKKTTVLVALMLAFSLLHVVSAKTVKSGKTTKATRSTNTNTRNSSKTSSGSGDSNKATLADKITYTEKSAKLQNSALQDDALWEETNASIEAGIATNSIRLLRLCLLAGLHLPESENLLKGYIASESAAIAKGRPFAELPESELQQLLHLQNEVCACKSSSAEDWRQLLKISRAFSGNQQLVIAAEAFLNKIRAGLPVKIDEDWIASFKELEGLLVKNTQALFRLQLCEILAGVESTAAEYAPKCENVRILAQANAAKILGQAEVAMALGEIEAARRYIGQVKDFDAAYPGLERVGQRLVKAVELQRLTVLITAAMHERRLDEAKRLCGQIQQLDPNNVFAKNILQQLNETGANQPGHVQSAEARVQLAIRRLEADLRKAEQEQDILQIRLLLKELLLQKGDSVSWIERLAEVENQISLSQLNADESFKQAQLLFNENRFNELRLFLNRNPGLMNSVETMVQVWEMRLMTNYHTGRLTGSELKEAAENLINRAGTNFSASFVLMKLAIADNRMDVARTHFQNAVKLNPSYPGLRWPGWLLWMHGDGRPVVVIVLIIVFFLLIQLLRPAFALYESTYWMRVGLLAKIFPSVALRSLEGCFGSYRLTEDRIKLFRLLVRCSNAVGDSKKVTMYTSNLHELAPGDPLAQIVKTVLPARRDAPAEQVVKNVSTVTTQVRSAIAVTSAKVDSAVKNTEAVAGDPGQVENDSVVEPSETNDHAERFAPVVPEPVTPAEPIEGLEQYGSILINEASEAIVATEMSESIIVSQASAVIPTDAAPDYASDIGFADSQMPDVADNLNTESLLNEEFESRIHEMRKAIFAELDAVETSQEPSPVWREANRQPPDCKWLFIELEKGEEVD